MQIPGERRRESYNGRNCLLRRLHQQAAELKQQQHHDRLPPRCRLGGGGRAVKTSAANLEVTVMLNFFLPFTHHFEANSDIL